MNKLVVIGDSHCIGYATAIQSMLVPVSCGPMGSANDFVWDNLVRTDDGEIELSGKLAERFAILAKHLQISSLADCKGRLVLSLGLAAARFFGGLDWNVNDYGTTADPKKNYVTSGVLDAMIAHLTGPSLSFVEHCIRQGWLVAAIAGPPPQLRHPAVRILGQVRVQELSDRYERPMRTLLADFRIPVIEPKGVSDDVGLLQRRYWGSNAAHGNVEYGKVIIGQLINEMASRQQ